MLLYLSFTLVRLVYYTKKKYFDAYNEHKFTFYTRAAVIYLSIFRCIVVQSTGINLCVFGSFICTKDRK